MPGLLCDRGCVMVLVVAVLVYMSCLTYASHTAVMCVVCAGVACVTLLSCVGVMCCVALWRVCVWVAVWVCVAPWQEREGGSLCRPSPSPHCCAHTHTHSVPWLPAVEMGGAGGVCGGSKIKLKIKACPESPSAPCGLVGRGGVAAAPPLQPRGAGCLSVCLAVQPGPCQAHCPSRPLRPCALHRSISDRWGQGGRQGQGKIKGVPRDRCGMLGQKQRRRDGETETLRLGWRPPDIKTGWCGAPETWRHRDRETWGSGDGAPWCPDSQGQTCREGGRTGGGGGPTGPGQRDREGRSGRQRPRDGRDACLHARDAGGAWEQGPERRSHGSSL